MTDTQYADLIPFYEHERLAALQPYRVLGTPGQEIFNGFVGIVAKLFDMPIALVSLVLEKDVVFVGNTGLPDAAIVGRKQSMCSVAILHEHLTVFEDVTRQPCELVDPFVAQQMQLGFYAGQALRAPGGMAIGSLCVLDHRPHHLTPAEGHLLEQLALVAQDILSLQAASAAETLQTPALQTRLEGQVQQSLNRLQTLADLRQWDTTDADTERSIAARLDEASYLAQTLHRELQVVLSGR